MRRFAVTAEKARARMVAGGRDAAGMRQSTAVRPPAITNRLNVSITVRMRSFDPVANWSWTKSMATLHPNTTPRNGLPSALPSPGASAASGQLQPQ